MVPSSTRRVTMKYLHQGVTYNSMDDLLEALIDDIMENDMDLEESL
jgi:hypothetical protein